MKNKLMAFLLCFVFCMSTYAKQIQPQLSEEQPAEEASTTWIGHWEIQCDVEKFPTAVSAVRYGNKHRTSIYICSATQTVSLIDDAHSATFSVKITPFYIMFNLKNMIVDNRYTALFIGNRGEPWHLYANCYDVPGDQSCVFLPGDKNDLSQIRNAMLHAEKLMVQTTEKDTGQPVHFIFPLGGYNQIYSTMQQESSAIDHAYAIFRSTNSKYK